MDDSDSRDSTETVDSVETIVSMEEDEAVEPEPETGAIKVKIEMVEERPEKSLPLIAYFLSTYFSNPEKSEQSKDYTKASSSSTGATSPDKLEIEEGSASGKTVSLSAATPP